MTTGYFGTPLGNKLSLKPGMRVWFGAMPDSVLAEIDMRDLVYLFAPEPDITEGTIRTVILPSTHLVDVRVCAVDPAWSGLKLMVRKRAR